MLYRRGTRRRWEGERKKRNASFGMDAPFKPFDISQQTKPVSHGSFIEPEDLVSDT